MSAGGGCLPSAWGGGVHTPVGQANTCENITFTQLLLRRVKTVAIFQAKSLLLGWKDNVTVFVLISLVGNKVCISIICVVLGI